MKIKIALFAVVGLFVACTAAFCPYPTVVDRRRTTALLIGSKIGQWLKRIFDDDVENAIEQYGGSSNRFGIDIDVTTAGYAGGDSLEGNRKNFRRKRRRIDDADFDPDLDSDEESSQTEEDKPRNRFSLPEENLDTITIKEMERFDNIRIRELRLDEVAVLEDMLYEAIYQPDKENLIPRDVIKMKEVSQYIDNFGQKEEDYCLVAEMNQKIIGAVWVRILTGEIKGFGNVDERTPEFAISLYPEYRKRGIGTSLMERMISDLKEKGYEQTSLSVQKGNYAFKLYQKLGFRIIKEKDKDYLMVLNLKDNQ